MPHLITSSVVIGLILIFGSLFFFLAGRIKVNKDEVIIIERMGIYKETWTEGIHHLNPLLEKRVGAYKKQLVTIQGVYLKQTIKITYQIDDFKTYHYSERNYPESLMLFLKVEQVSLEDLENQLNIYSQKYGIVIKSLSLTPIQQ